MCVLILRETGSLSASVVSLWWWLSPWVVDSRLFAESSPGWERGQASSVVSLMIRALIPHEGFSDCPHLNLITSQRLHLQIPSHWSWGFNIYMLGKRNSVHNTYRVNNWGGVVCFGPVGHPEGVSKFRLVVF